MRTLVTQRADALDLREYGRLHDLLTGSAPDVVATEGTGWHDRYTGEPVVFAAAHLGMTVGPAIATDVWCMEQHPHTSETIVAQQSPIVVPVALEPRAQAVQALLVGPGQCLTLRPGVYHGPGMGVDGPSRYYWIAGVDPDAGDSWCDILDGPVRIRMRDDHE
jgi:ureidoglycolate hydrolase